MNLKLLSLQILTLSALVALSLVIAGTNQPAASAATMDTSDSIIISIPSAIVDLNPLFSNSYYNHYVYQSVYQPLYALYNNTNNLYNWHIVPILAGSYTVTPNGTTWIFNIRPGQVWSDGIPLNASDILFTYQILMNKYIDLNYYSSWSAFFKDNSSNSMRVVNATQLVFNLLPDNLPANTTYIISEVFTTSIFPKHIFGPLGNNPQAWQNDITNTGTGISRTVTADNKVIKVNGPIGSGPYTYAGYDTTNKVWTLMANQRFNAAIQGLKAPSIQTIKLTIISDATTAWTALNAGQIQVVDYNTISFATVFLQPNTNTSVSHPVSFKVDNYQELGYNQFNPIWGMNPVDPVPFYTNYNITLQNGWWSAIDNGNTSNTVRYPHNITWINHLHLAAAKAGLGNITADRWFYNNLNDSERLDIRLAMDYAIPRQNNINTILNGQGTTLPTRVTPYFNIYDPNIQARPFNESISESLLAQVFGYTYNISATDYTSVP